MKSIVAICLALFTLCHSLPVPTSSLNSRQQDLETITDTLLFSTSMDDFQAAKAAEQPPELDWFSEGCTASPDEPLGYSFTPSCNRHDFGYQNYQAQGRFTDDNKHLIDLQFKTDLYNECNKHSAISGTVCKGVANVYYEAVSLFGSLKKKRSLDEHWEGLAEE